MLLSPHTSPVSPAGIQILGRGKYVDGETVVTSVLLFVSKFKREIHRRGLIPASFIQKVMNWMSVFSVVAYCDRLM